MMTGIPQPGAFPQQQRGLGAAEAQHLGFGHVPFEDGRGLDCGQATRIVRPDAAVNEPDVIHHHVLRQIGRCRRSRERRIDSR